MYKSTKWLDDVVDTETGDLIQSGTPLSADNLNNIETGISDAHVATALLAIALGQLRDEKEAAHGGL